MKQRFSAFLNGISVFFHSIRFRLSIWFGVVLAIILLMFSGFVYYRQMQDVRDSTITRLIVRQRELYGTLMAINREFGGESEYPPVISALSFGLQNQEVLLISDPQGQVLGTWGTINDNEATLICNQAKSLAINRDTLSAISTHLEGSGDYLFLPSPLIYENRVLGWMMLGQPADPQGQMPRLALTLALGAAFTLLIALAGGYWMADRALWPVKAITRTAREIGETDLSRRLNIRTRDELGELAGTFDRMLDRLQAAFIRQRQFTADASHELRTPLTIVGLETGRALSSARSNEDFRQALRVIQSENEFMSHLVNELLTLARMDAGQVKLKTEPIDLSDLALEVVERFAPLASHKGVQLKTGDLPELTIQGDRQYLGQMIGNLVDNAIKYSPSGAGRWVQIETMSGPDGNACLRVTDNGAGIPTDDLPHLFDRFYRVDRARSHNPGEDSQEEIPGSGLGLAIVQWIAQMHGGSARVESEIGKGSCFEIQLPTKT